jgi:N utilization substance protein A
MEVIVEDKQLSLAIGKKGQNVRLAAKLTGWKIDIKSEEETRKEVEIQLGALEIGEPADAAPDADAEPRDDADAEPRDEAGAEPAADSSAQPAEEASAETLETASASAEPGIAEGGDATTAAAESDTPEER